MKSNRIGAVTGGLLCMVAVSVGPSWGESLDDAWAQALEISASAAPRILAGHVGAPAGVKAQDLKAGSAQADWQLIKDAPEVPSLPEPLAVQPVFKIKYTEERDSGAHEFWPLERLGVRKSAEARAIAECLAHGLSPCVAITSYITDCGGYYTCDATAIAKELLTPPGFVRRSFSLRDRVRSGDKPFSDLERRGAIKTIEEAGVSDCQGQGLVDCATIASRITGGNPYFVEVDVTTVGFQQSSAEATKDFIRN